MDINGINEFIVKHWVALVSLLIALSGGIPGILQIKESLQAKSKFEFKLENTVYGETNDKKFLMVLLSGTIANFGEQPLIPASFDLKIKVNKKWYKMARQLIPENMKFHSDDAEISFKEPWNMDFQKMRMVITELNPVYGHIIFSNNSLKLKDVKHKTIEYKLTCTDILGKNYTYLKTIEHSENPKSYINSKLNYNIKMK